MPHSAYFNRVNFKDYKMGRQRSTGKNITIQLTAGRLPLAVLAKVNELASTRGYGVYLSTIQNLRLTGIPEEELGTVKGQLQAAGAELRAAGRFPKPKVCVGKPSCNLGLAEIDKLAKKIWGRFGSRIKVKPKFKIALAACPASCSNALLTDIGVIATRKGYDIYFGGKGGTRPRVGVRIVRGVDEERVLAVIEQLVALHDSKPGSKLRMFKLLDDPDFPFPVNDEVKSKK